MILSRAVFLLPILTAAYGLLVPQFMDVDISDVSSKSYTILSEDVDLPKLVKEFPNGRILSDTDGGRILIHDMSKLLARLNPRAESI